MSRKPAPVDPELTHRLTRRGVLGVAAGATAAALAGTAAAAGPASAATTPSTGSASGEASTKASGKGRGRPVLPPGRLGVQLYSLRDKVSSLGFATVFAELARYGYDEIEFAGYAQGSAGAITLAQLKRLARDHGLTAIGSHVGYANDGDPNAYTFAQNLTKVLDDAEALGLKHIGTASGPFRHGNTVDALKRAAEDFNTYGEAARARGMKFYQHNHAEEFSFATDKPSVRLYDVLLAETDPDLVFLEMDIYWAYSARFRFGKQVDGTPRPFDPIAYVLRQPHRYPLFHVKDGIRDDSTRDGYRMVDVGDGDIDYKRFLSKVTSRTHGGRRYHHWQVEHDSPTDSFAFARKSSAHLHALRERCGD
ncbi:sugar phosphate isomerase/epimerase family protein [Streptomyces spectabilis]|uniref:Sugar phosphate isomerase/epimerase n=1 Tax=Streptomyces spectabilis TaxID=68270 RepID=A0A5P2XJ26_STRST|nr:sugar phosphate isomerase/epimerase [Streptomyces spectabilis]MBB5107101.1 sugar phosphate isomerase/epimerase [Streptomyces spectabilis]MCI3906149.1 sugar phosphate isomerase/epimerase [Streptomyces spectabilis]QEV63030.1 sugar phosphate isomerase/epimerase [Streptomyces spectabilis]GGV04584.1 sugar phosphate isomerase [Streptomyces spectabilis]